MSRNNKPPQKQQINPAQANLQLQVCQKSLLEAQAENKSLNERLQNLQNAEDTFAARRQDFEANIRASEAEIRRQYFEEQSQGLRDKLSEATSKAEELILAAKSKASEIRDVAERGIRERLTEVENREGAVTAREKDLIREAELQRGQLLSEAQAESERILEQAGILAEQTVGEAAARAAEQQAALIAELSRREREIEDLARSNKRRSAELTVLTEDVEFEREQNSAKKIRLEERWRECAPGRVVELDLQLQELTQLSSSLQERLRAAQAETERLQRLLSGTSGRSLEELADAYQRTEARRQELQDQLLNYPPQEEIAYLRQLEPEAKLLREQSHRLQSELIEAQSRASRNELHARELDNARAQHAAAVILNKELRDEIDRNANTLQGRQGQRFKKLIALDGTATAADTNPAVTAPAPQTLRALVEHVRLFAASQKPALYYSETTIRAFLAGMATSSFSILQGLSGTGKTSLPRVFAELIGGRVRRIAVQSNWRDRHELLGYNNEFTREFSESEFTEAMYESSLPRERNRVWLIVLDEMNLARVEYYFADFLSALEETDPEQRRIRLLHFDPAAMGETTPQYLAGGDLRVPGNVWFVGTANEDQSTFEITDKVYDRAQVIEFFGRSEPFPIQEAVGPTFISSNGLKNVFLKSQAKSEYQLSEEDSRYVSQVDEFLLENFELTFGHRIDTQIRKFVPVFVAAGGRKGEAIDFLLARKVLRKLEGRHESGLRPVLEQLIQVIQNVPAGYEEPKHSLDVLSRKIRRIASGAA